MWSWHELWRQQAIAARANVDALFTWLAERNSVYGLGKSHAEVYAASEALAAKLRVKPITHPISSARSTGASTPRTSARTWTARVRPWRGRAAIRWSSPLTCSQRTWPRRTRASSTSRSTAPPGRRITCRAGWKARRGWSTSAWPMSSPIPTAFRRSGSHSPTWPRGTRSSSRVRWRASVSLTPQGTVAAGEVFTTRSSRRRTGG